ncbi:hypothetical protein ACFO1S_12665 [Cohnella boryungensis]|uniref:Sporulation protein YjcZ n=1 Tax=Cohnella boryungensis TaxID=768479 RepID=A0ABV8SBK7_9BACL
MTNRHKKSKVVNDMGYPVAGEACGVKGAATGAAAIALVLFVLLVIILSAGACY